MSDFLTRLTEIEEKQLLTEVGKMMTAAGFKVLHTGGGCLAWNKDLPTGEYLWICDEGNGLGDTPDETYLVGRYKKDGQMVDENADAERPNLAAALEWAVLECAC